MTGHYKTIDGSEYQVFFADVRTEKKTVNTLVAKCTKGLKQSEKPFPVSEENINRNIRFGSWVKIEK